MGDHFQGCCLLSVRFNLLKSQ